uniref:CSON002603 protein n=1 Tax=Culicoides sonorensis TaxID=179676 RepID=A0A336MNY2_CULSO
MNNIHVENPNNLNENRLRTDVPYHGFDNSCGKNWIYPTNYPKRDYQYSISKKALFENTLVVLPTGLGKTFIAAVIMYNFYRWYPRSKLIFMAPARPLVDQQINACYEVMGIPKEDTVEITGRKSKKNRSELWKTKRVFFATPQAVLSDIFSPEHEFPVGDIRLVVIDEAHKAKGKYAYTEVIRLIHEKNQAFRVLALSATPGRELKDVREIAQNLLISHIEVRYETSLDVAPYTFRKLIKTEVVQFDSRIKKHREELIQIIHPYVEILKEANLLRGNAGSHSKGWIIMKQNEFRRLSAIEPHPNNSELLATFSILVSLYHSLEVLERHGCRMFLSSFQDEQNRTGFKYFVNQNHHLKSMLEDLKQELGVTNISLDRSLNQSVSENPNFDYGHPKFRVLEKKLLEHFTADPDSKAIVFCDLRESVLLVGILLSQHKPTIRPLKMVGQGTSTGLRAVTQKEQLEVMEEFKNGRCNCLVATCVVEEGIDVGDVKLIVCFDSSTNPTRYVQRIGRTGRKQQGNVLMLVSEGREHDNLKNVLKSKDKTTQKLCNKKETEWFLYKNSPRLVPPEFSPACMEVCFDVKRKESVDIPSTRKGQGTNKRKNKENSLKPSKIVRNKAPAVDMRTFFKPLDTSVTFDDNLQNNTSNDTSIASSPKTNRIIAKPKFPNSSNHSMMNFTLDESKTKSKTPSKKNDAEWEFIEEAQISLKRRKFKKKLDYATDREILDCSMITNEMITYLLTKPNADHKKPTKELQAQIKNKANENFDEKRVKTLLDCVKNFETILKNEELENDDINFDESQSSFNFDCATDNFTSTSFIDSNFDLNEPSRYYNPIIDTPQYETFDPKINKITESTPIRTKFLETPSTSKSILTSKISDNVAKFTTTKINEQEVLNSLGLKSLDDLFSDDDFEDEPEITSKKIDSPKPSPKVISTETIRVESKFQQKLEFVDLDNIFGSSDDDLFEDIGDNFKFELKNNSRDENVLKEEEELSEKLNTSVPENILDNVNSNHVIQHRNKSPDNLLEKSISRLNSSLSEFLANELLELEKEPKSEKSRTSFNTSTPKLQKRITTPEKTHIKSQQPNQTSPSLFSGRFSSKIKTSNTTLVSKSAANGTPKASCKKSLAISPMTQIIRPVARNKRFRKILSDSEDESEPKTIFEDKHQSKKIKLDTKPKTRTKKSRGHCTFLDDQAEGSGDDSEYEDSHNMTGFSELDSFVVENETFNETIGANIYAKYVESTKSPRNLGRFKIPQQLKPFNQAEIFSQAVPVEASQYLNDSFVCEEEEDDGVDMEVDELEIAEAILAAEKRKKRKKKL